MSQPRSFLALAILIVAFGGMWLALIYTFITAVTYLVTH